jgi:hypothetical protein
MKKLIAILLASLSITAFAQITWLKHILLVMQKWASIYNKETGIQLNYQPLGLVAALSKLKLKL